VTGDGPTGVERGLTAWVVDRVRLREFDDLPDDVVELARQCTLDWLAVTLAGSGEPVSRLVAAEVLDQGGAPQASLIGRPERVAAAHAALANGTAGHALDYDDVAGTFLGHPSAPVLPALLALAERGERSGRDVVAAFVAGFEAESLLGRTIVPGHYERGWHTTATLGTFGAAAACAHLLGLDEVRWAHAFGLAATQAGGLKASFGTMGKPFHAGRAAQAGLLAATLARRTTPPATSCTPPSRACSPYGTAACGPRTSRPSPCGPRPPTSTPAPSPNRPRRSRPSSACATPPPWPW
jgi:2-methylcitrate dehydratase PrpD